MKKEQYFLISEQDRNALVDYLSGKPFREVEAAIYVLRMLNPASLDSVKDKGAETTNV